MSIGLITLNHACIAFRFSYFSFPFSLKTHTLSSYSLIKYTKSRIVHDQSKILQWKADKC